MKYFAIFGNPVSHSISPLMHNLAIKGLKLNACYSRYPIEDGSRLKEIFFKLGIDGANITIPHKEIAFEICDEVRGIAKEIGSVNTIIKKRDKLIGYNSDAPGFYQSISEFEDIKDILILGAGGTAKAIAYFLREKRFNITIVNRSEKRLKYFQERDFETQTWDNLILKPYSLVINTTSAGLNKEILPLPKELLLPLFKEAKYGVDVIYNKNTPFLKEAKKSGLITKDGSDMLLYQGVIAFYHFFDGKFSQEEITIYMREAFNY